MALALSRTCRLGDFAGCRTPGDWQQALAREAWRRQWGSETEPPAQGQAVLTYCLNWSGWPFEAPGHPVYATAIEALDRSDQPAGGIFALSVLDRVDAPLLFLRAAAARLGVGGVIVCTFAAWNAYGPDVAYGHGRRRRIYTFEPRLLTVGKDRSLIAAVREVGLHLFGGVDWRYHGDVLGDHTIATLVFQRRAL